MQENKSFMQWKRASDLKADGCGWTFLSLHFITLMISESGECNYSVDM